MTAWASDAEPPTHHYGLAIMRDQPTTLGGTLQVADAEGGTRVGSILPADHSGHRTL